MLLYSQLKAFQETKGELLLEVPLGRSEENKGQEGAISGEELLERLLDYCLANLPGNTRGRFTLNNFTSKLNIKTDDSLRLLLFGHDRRKIRINHEVSCPQASCHNLVSSASHREDIPDSPIDCPTCGHRFTPTDDDIWITFSVM
jgi:hypothetical protein